MRLRTSLRRAASLVALLLTAAWLLSGWWRLHCTLAPLPQWKLAFVFNAGSLTISHTWGFPGARVVLECSCDRSDGAFSLLRFQAALGLHHAFLIIPIWALALAVGLAAVTRRVRAASSECRGCGYDRGGLLPAQPCPECGMVPPAQPLQPVCNPSDKDVSPTHFS